MATSENPSKVGNTLVAPVVSGGAAPSHIPTPRSLENARTHGSSIFRNFKTKRPRVPDNRDDYIIKPNLERYPKGYPRIAAFADSDRDSALCRRFGTLRARLILYLEVEITDLEDKLLKLDVEDGEDSEKAWRNSSAISTDDGDQNEERKGLIEKISKKLKEYDELVLRDSEIRKLVRPSKKVHRNLFDWVYTENTIIEEDMRFIYHDRDFISLQVYDESWLDELVYDLIYRMKIRFITWLFTSSDDRTKSSDPGVQYFSEKRLRNLIKIIIAMISTIMLLAPIYLFIALNQSTILITSITLLFTFCFSVAISVFSTAKRQEIFAATAAYCAVLVVFIGNLQQNCPGCSSKGG